MKITIQNLKDIDWKLNNVNNDSLWFKKGIFTMKIMKDTPYVKIGKLDENDKLKTYFYGIVEDMEKLTYVLDKLKFN